MKRVIFIGQAMPRHKTDLHDWPSLNRWLYSIGLTDVDIKNNFYYSALVDYFPGSKNGTHLVPTKFEISKERFRLQKTLLDFNPEIVVPVGSLSIFHCLCIKSTPLTDVIGQIFHSNPYNLLDKILPIIPFPHPSGASTWHHNPSHLHLLTRTLNLLKQHLI